MKTLKIVLFFTGVILSGVLMAQKFSYVDTEYILDKIPEYKSAQKQLDNMAEQWKKDVGQKMKEIDKLYKQYQAEQVFQHYI